MVRKRSAFTLVELLVVIGIIALLISILLPSLSRARQAANLIDCQSRLRQMGQAMQLYVAETNGTIPYAEIYHLSAHITGSPEWQGKDRRAALGHEEEYWKWMYTLSESLGYQVIDQNGWAAIHPIFTDKDAVEGQEWGWLNHYSVNPRVFRMIGDDNAPGEFSGGQTPNLRPADVLPYNIASIKNASEVMAIWDAPQGLDFAFNTRGVGQAMDGWAYYWGHCYYLNHPGNWITYDRAVPPGPTAGPNTDGAPLQKQMNYDPAEIWVDWTSELRFRHMNNTTLATLFLDGHAEIRKAGEVTLRDISTNFNSYESRGGP